MIPQAPNINIGEVLDEAEVINKTYKLNIEGKRINGFVDGLDSIKQAVFKILQTERYESIIYGWDYGVEFKNLIGKPKDYVENDLQRVISEALKTDIRIISVTDFIFNYSKNSLEVLFRVASIEGDFKTSITLSL